MEITEVFAMARASGWIAIFLLVNALTLSACQNGSSGSGSSGSGSSGSGSSGISTYTISGTVSGLAANQSLSLQNNAGDTLIVPVDGAFQFATGLLAGASYAVTITAQPGGQQCVLNHASGTVGSSHVTDVFVTCVNQGVTVLHDFGSATGDGTTPQGGLVMDASGNLYGTTVNGGAYGLGTVFELSASGDYRVLHSFGSGTDGANPVATMIMDGAGNLYGTTVSGGESGRGTVFTLTPSTPERVVYSFGPAPDGANPQGKLVQVGNNLFGTTVSGGAFHNGGTVFQVTLSTGAEWVLHSFGDVSDGYAPYGGLLFAGSNGAFYGTTSAGGAADYGTLFSLIPSSDPSVPPRYTLTGSFVGSTDSHSPRSSLIQALFQYAGTAYEGGAYGKGTLFGPGLSYAFGSVAGDGANPWGAMVVDANGHLYGTTVNGGAKDMGTLFFRDTSIPRVVFAFDGSSGAHPYGDLMIDSNGFVYGTTSSGGAHGSGTMFRYVP